VTRATAEERDAKQKWQRATALASQGLVAQADVDSARATYDAAIAGVSSARASLAQARAGLKQSETNLAYTVIVSPIDGVVISRDVDRGQTVAASLQAPTLFTIAEDLSKMEVHTSVAESDVGSLAADMPVEFSVDAYPSERFRGVVQQVRYSPTTVSNVVTYDAVVAVDNPDLKLRPGMTADVTFVTEEREEALAVPSAALRFRPPPEALAELGLTEEEIGGRRGRAAERRGPATEHGAPVAERGGGPVAERGGGPVAERGDGPVAEGAGPAAGGGRRGRGAGGRSRRVVWKLGPNGKPQPVTVRVGINDGRVTEIVDGALAEGDQVITGMGGADGAAAPAGRGVGQQGGGRGRRRPGQFL
jgi:HlyD family secretion protein